LTAFLVYLFLSDDTMQSQITIDAILQPWVTGKGLSVRFRDAFALDRNIPITDDVGNSYLIYVAPAIDAHHLISIGLTIFPAPMQTVKPGLKGVRFPLENVTLPELSTALDVLWKRIHQIIAEAGYTRTPNEATTPAPRLIGYWFNGFTDYDRQFPHPRILIKPNWISPDEKIALLHYLRSSPEFEVYRGLSCCRFDCGDVGHREYWDGVWAWPEGLSHYVECHDVMLPEEFVQHALTHPILTALRPPEDRPCDIEYWLGWTDRYRSAEPT